MTARYLAPKALVDIVAIVFAKAGCPADITIEVSDNLLETNMGSHASHGVRPIASSVWASQLRRGVRSMKFPRSERSLGNALPEVLESPLV